MKSAEQLLNEIDSTFAHKHTRQADNMVLLAHDQVFATADDSLQLRKFLQMLKQTGEYELSLISDYPGQKPSRQ